MKSVIYARYSSDNRFRDLYWPGVIGKIDSHHEFQHMPKTNAKGLFDVVMFRTIATAPKRLPLCKEAHGGRRQWRK